MREGLGILFAGFVLLSCAIWLVLHPPQARAAEIGFDAGFCLQIDQSHPDLIWALPAPIGAEAPVLQIVRIGLPLSDSDQIEFAPGLLHSSFDRYYSFTRLALGVSYLRGRVAGGSPAPYARVGGHLRLESNSAPYYDETGVQFGISGGAGLKWKVGEIVGFRSEALALRWFRGGLADSWDLALRGGISVFTK